MKPLALFIALAIVLAGCDILPTLTPEPSPTEKPTANAPFYAAAIGTVHIRNRDGKVIGYLDHNEIVVVHGIEDGWCWIDPERTKKVWCACLGLGNKDCKNR